MIDSPNRTLAQLLIYAVTAALSLLVVALFMVIAAGGPSVDGIRAFWCLVTPASIFDWVVRSSGFGASFLGLVTVVSVVRTANRERAVAGELTAAARAARLRSIPFEVASAASAVGVEERLDMVDSTRPFAFVYGWVRPRICVSTGMVERPSQREFEAVLHHERWHLSRRDPARLLVVRMIAAAFSFVPSIRRQARQCRLATEIAADRHAIAMMGSQRWLAGALLKLVGEDAQGAGVPFNGLSDARIAAIAGEIPAELAGRGRFASHVFLGEMALLLLSIIGGGSGLLALVLRHHVC